MNKKDYDDGWGDQPWFENKDFAAALLDKIYILDILDKYGIPYARVSSGNFTHKMKCPIPGHDERTASFCVSEDNNDFHCFGCNANGNVVDLVMLLKGVPYYKAVELLNNYLNNNGEFINDTDIKPRERVKPEHTIVYYIFRAGVMLRQFVRGKTGTEKYNKWVEWSEKQFDKMDFYLETLEDSDWEKAKKYHDKLQSFLDKR